MQIPVEIEIELGCHSNFNYDHYHYDHYHYDHYHYDHYHYDHCYAATLKLSTFKSMVLWTNERLDLKIDFMRWLLKLAKFLYLLLEPCGHAWPLHTRIDEYQSMQ